MSLNCCALPVHSRTQHGFQVGEGGLRIAIGSCTCRENSSRWLLTASGSSLRPSRPTRIAEVVFYRLLESFGQKVAVGWIVHS